MKDEHRISNNIRSYYKWRLVFPVLFLLLILVLSFFYPLKSSIWVDWATIYSDFPALYKEKTRTVNVGVEKLYFTGYKKEFMGRTVGYYYYAPNEDETSLILFLVSPKTSSEGIPVIEDKAIIAEIKPLTPSENTLLSHLAEDLSWSEKGLSESVCMYYLDEPEASNIAGWLLRVSIIVFSLYSVIIMIHYIICILFPHLAPPIRRLRAYGKPKRLLRRAERELATLPQLATEDMFITEHFFIETSVYGTAIVPIKEIIWIYKYSTLHKFLWHHFSISYTLHITANKRIYIHCPKNDKTDIDGIIDYLSEANHNILVGFSEENRLKVEAIFGDLNFMRKFFAFLSKKV
ncbi:MAG: hypothetical protein IIZ61_07880 [Lachnospiraceae bacterium]|nr:hypothetical protein [Lachnospiraceae bacterium]